MEEEQKQYWDTFYKVLEAVAIQGVFLEASTDYRSD